MIAAVPVQTPAPAGESAPHRLERVYACIHAQRMRDLPILNPRLFVESIGFEEGAQGWFGALITPWFLNLVFLPGAGATGALAPGATGSRALPGAAIDMIGAWHEELGAFEACSLLSPVTQLADQATARAVARLALADLRTAPGTPLAAPADAAPMSKRDFLLGLRRDRSR